MKTASQADHRRPDGVELSVPPAVNGEWD